MCIYIGASATIGFEGLSAVAKELDDLVRTGTVEGCMPLVDRLDAELATVSRALIEP